MRRRWLVWVVGAALLALAASLLLRGSLSQISRDRTGLFTSLPLLWAESADLADMLKPQQDEHWAKPLIAGGGEVIPLDTLSATSLKGLKYLVLAQPRPLSPDENVALDGWVRSGGLLLLFADPMLTEETIFPLGDKRRPQDIAMVDPVLNHWGLRLEFDSEDEFKEGPTAMMGMTIPVNAPGRLIATKPECRAWDQGDLATCKIGNGRVAVLADAAVLEREDTAGSRAKALRLLLETAFSGVRP
jgi:hypothetical protein